MVQGKKMEEVPKESSCCNIWCYDILDLANKEHEDFQKIHVNTSFVIAQIQREIRERINTLHCSKRAYRCSNLVTRICNYIVGVTTFLFFCFA